MIFIGDVHGKYEEYVTLSQRSGSSIQVGDMGFDYSHMKNLCPANHVFISGNHDDQNKIENCHNYLGRFGESYLPEIGAFFFVGGAYSIDQRYRIEGKSWWRNEELSHDECNEALHQYDICMPSIVVSHDCPQKASSALFGITDRSMTRNILSEMFSRWKPKLWVFGHWHKSARIKINGTQFVCLDELETFNPKEGEIKC